MSCVTVELNIPKEIIGQPVIWSLGRLYRVVTNLLRARISAETAIATVSIEGSAGEVEATLNYLRGLHVIDGECSGSLPESPSAAIEQPATIAVRLRTVNPGQAAEPVLSKAARDYRVVINIVYAALDQDEGGVVDILISGALLEVQRTIAFLHTTGISVSPRERSVSDNGNL